MEEAYNELYQQFLRLRSLCLRQAALLHELTTAQKKTQGALIPNGELSDMMSIPVQCTQEIPVYFHEKPQPLAAAAHNPASQCADWRHMGTFSNLLAEDMAKLSVGVPRQRKEDRLLEPKVASSLSLDCTGWQAASSTEYKMKEQTDDFNRDRTLHETKMPVTDGSSLVDNFLNQSDGFLMSDVVLQSHICEFCQAVFPGDTTTRGEFLRHLHTHIT